MITNEKHYEAFKWCVENNIRIYPKLRKSNYILIYEINGVAKTSGMEYQKNEYMEAIWDFYLFLFNKFKDAST